MPAQGAEKSSMHPLTTYYILRVTAFIIIQCTENASPSESGSYIKLSQLTQPASKHVIYNYVAVFQVGYNARTDSICVVKVQLEYSTSP